MSISKVIFPSFGLPSNFLVQSELCRNWSPWFSLGRCGFWSGRLFGPRLLPGACVVCFVKAGPGEPMGSPSQPPPGLVGLCVCWTGLEEACEERPPWPLSSLLGAWTEPLRGRGPEGCEVGGAGGARHQAVCGGMLTPMLVAPAA